MIKVFIKATGKVIEVTPNIAHDLIDSGKGELYRGQKLTEDKPIEIPKPVEEVKPTIPFYPNRQITSDSKSKDGFRTR